MTLDNEDAEINVGENVPYITSQQSFYNDNDNLTCPSLNYNSYEYRDVGVILNITPHINEENFIRLKISLQVTKLTSAATSTTPTTLKRTAKTTVWSKITKQSLSAVWWGTVRKMIHIKCRCWAIFLILGWLFKTHSTSREKTNLYVFLTPHIVRPRRMPRSLSGKKGNNGRSG